MMNPLSVPTTPADQLAQWIARAWAPSRQIAADRKAREEPEPRGSDDGREKLEGERGGRVTPLPSTLLLTTTPHFHETSRDSGRSRCGEPLESLGRPRWEPPHSTVLVKCVNIQREL